MSTASNLFIKYIVLSDLHLGEEDSLFTPSREGNYNLLNAFSKSLQSLVSSNENEELPTLILNGDIIGLSFSTYQESLTVFDQFIKSLAVEHEICNQIAYIPGNHDHHIWQLAMESQYRRKLENRDTSDPIPSIDRTSSAIFKNGLQSEFIEAFVNGHSEMKIELKVLYPNMIIPANEANQAFVIIHHGHYAEKTYHFISDSLKALYPEESTPNTLEDLEADNGAWINFAFSELGRSGAAGEKFEKLMNTLSSIEMFDKQSGELSENIAKALDYPYIPFHSVEKFLTRRLIQNIANKIRSERYQEGTVCSEEAMLGLKQYMEKYCAPQMKLSGWEGQAATLIWGHTHKPFSLKTCTQSFDELKVVNSGGWVLPEEPKPTHGGSFTLISNKNEVVELRIWNDSHNNGKMKFRVIPTEGEQLSEFGQSIMAIINDGNKLNEIWNALRLELIDEIQYRRKNVPHEHK